MDMREKVINGLGECIDYFDGKVTGVMFNEWLEESRKAIALLKAQEPVRPKPDTSYGARPWWFVCGNCKLSVNEDQKYCPHCGKGIRWNG